MRAPALILSALVIGCFALITGCDTPEIRVSATPTKIIQEEIGRGRPATIGDTVTIAYTLELSDGTLLLKDKEFPFRLGAGVVIEGIDDSVIGMREGGSRIVLIPPHKHWGSNGYANGKVPRNETLKLHVRLKNVSS